MTTQAHADRALRATLFAAMVAASARTPAAAETVYLSEETDARSDIVGGLENRRFSQPDVGAESIWAGAMNMRMHAEGNFAGAFDLALGGGPGFYYVTRMMFGPAFALPGDGRVALVGGVGVSGLTDGELGIMVGAHYEVYMKGDQCSSPELVR